MMGHIILVGLAIGCITGIEIFALCQGVNGLALSLSIGAVSGLGGYEIKAVKEKLLKK